MSSTRLVESQDGSQSLIVFGMTEGQALAAPRSRGLGWDGVRVQQVDQNSPRWAGFAVSGIASTPEGPIVDTTSNPDEESVVESVVLDLDTDEEEVEL